MISRINGSRLVIKKLRSPVSAMENFQSIFVFPDFFSTFPRLFPRLFPDFFLDFFPDFFPDFFLDFFLDFFPGKKGERKEKSPEKKSGKIKIDWRFSMALTGLRKKRMKSSLARGGSMAGRTFVHINRHLIRR